MARQADNGDAADLPKCAAEFIGQVIRGMRYRRKARDEVQAELTAHFTDELKDCANAAEKEQKAQKMVEGFGDAKLLAILCRRAKKRCRPLWHKILVRGALGLGVIFLYLVLCTLPLILGRPTIRVNYVQWMSERWRPQAGEVENARVYYDKAVELYVKPSQGLEGMMAAPGWKVRDCNEAEQALLSEWLAQNGPAFDMLRRGAGVERYWPLYDAARPDLADPSFLGDSLREFAGYRRVVFALRDRIDYVAERGRLDEALDDCLVIQGFGRHLQAKGLLMEQLVGIAIEALGTGRLRDVLGRYTVPLPVLERIQSRMMSDFNADRRVIDLESEKVLWYDRIQRTFTDDGEGGGHALGGGMPYAAGGWTGNLLGILRFDYPDRREAVAMVEQYFKEAQQTFERPPNAKGLGLDAQTHIPAENLLLGLTAPAYERVVQQVWRLRTNEAATLAILAILRYEGEKGRYPADLAEVVQAGLLPDVPQDPFGAGPLTYRQTTDGFLLYSWGENHKDDGGRLGTTSNGRPRMWANNGDWVFWPVKRDVK